MDFKRQVLGENVQFKEMLGETWVLANDVGRILGLARTRDTIDRYVSANNQTKEWVKYLTGNKQRYHATLLNVDGLIEMMRNTQKGSDEDKRQINNLVIATMITNNESINQVEEPNSLLSLNKEELYQLNNEILLEHIYDLRGQLQTKEEIIESCQNKLQKIENLIDEVEHELR